MLSDDVKRDFVAELSSMTVDEINEYIKANGKPMKQIFLCVNIHDKNKVTYESLKEIHNESTRIN